MYRLVLFLSIIVTVIDTSVSTPLDDYVNKPDPTFSWKLIRTYPSSTYTVYVLNMTSQTWMDASFSSQPVWWHYMIITVPQTIVCHQNSFLFVSGGNNNDDVPTGSSITPDALVMKSVTVELKQIPNQPIQFMADPSREIRFEDAIVAWTWKTFIESNGSNPYILLRMPMTKAVVRAMDTTQEFLRQQGVPVPQNFVVGGLSKRGWTTWTTAAVDNTRVVAAVPMVLDILNLRKNMIHHYQSLAGWTFAFRNYYVENITLDLDNPYFQAMADIVDPYSYFDRYRKTKILQLQGADDEFFLPDSEDYFWTDLQKATGGSYLRRIPNVGHAIKGYDGSLQSFYISVCNSATLPLWTWTRTTNETHGELRANVSIADGHPSPVNVTVYQARTTNGTKRDFRQEIVDPSTGSVVPNPVQWLPMPGLEKSQVGQSIIYTYTAPMPPTGHWDGIFLEGLFPGPDDTFLTLTTETLTIPDTFPVGPCSGAQCYGTLV